MANYEIKKLKTEKNDMPLTKGMKEGVIPRFPSSVLISGRSGSGKTMLLLNMFNNPDLCGAYYHCILVFSPTAGHEDDTYKSLKIPDENFIADFNAEQLDHIINMRKSMIKNKGIKWTAENCRMCIILDDVIANRSFLESPAALKMFALLRHYLCSVFILIQSFNKVPRALRLNCNGLYIFPSAQSEIEVLKKEITPAGMNKKRFEDLIEYCTRGRHDFIAINNHAEPGKRIRKCLTELINIDEYKK